MDEILPSKIMLMIGSSPMEDPFPVFQLYPRFHVISGSSWGRAPVIIQLLNDWDFPMHKNHPSIHFELGIPSISSWKAPDSTPISILDTPSTPLSIQAPNATRHQAKGRADGAMLRRLLRRVAWRKWWRGC